MISNVMCNTGHAPPPPPPSPSPAQAELYFQMTKNKLKDPKGPENIICSMMMHKITADLTVLKEQSGKGKHCYKAENHVTYFGYIVPVFGQKGGKIVQHFLNTQQIFMR